MLVERSGLDRRLAILAVGLGTAVAMWLVGYLGRLPVVMAPGPVMFIGMLACLVGGGVVLGRRSDASVVTGVVAGAATCLVNLLILGSLLSDTADGSVAPSAALWVPGAFIVSSGLVAIGVAIGRRRRAAALDAEAWRTRVVLVAMAATLLVIVAGGLVTTTETGLAVPDWPNTFGSNMFLFPLSRMTGGIYLEHAHRLYGSLVGLSTILLAITMWTTDHRASVRWFAVSLVGAVIVQGVMGGIRVTEISTATAVAHGIFAQIVFAALGVLFAVTTATWRTATPVVHEGAAGDRALSLVVLALLLVQLTFGAMYRHMYTVEAKVPWPAHAHFTFAAVIAVVGHIFALRILRRHRSVPALALAGRSVLVVLGLQYLLGFVALIAVMARKAEPTAFEVVFATAHQANGALLVVCTTIAAALLRRLVVPSAVPASAPAVA